MKLNPLSNVPGGRNSALNNELHNVSGPVATPGKMRIGWGGGGFLKSFTEYLWFNTDKRRDYLNITRQVTEIVEKSEIREGMVLVSAMHITAGVYVNDAEDGIIQDIDDLLERLAPFRPDYLHHRTGEDNGDAHLKSILVHHQVVLPITGGRLDLGPWQQVFYAEFDGRRRKRVVVKVMGA